MEDWEKKFKIARDEFLSLIADSTKWEVEPDGDTDSNGRMVDCTTYIIRGPIRSLEQLCEALDIKAGYCEPIEDAITRAIESE